MNTAEQPLKIVNVHSEASIPNKIYFTMQEVSKLCDLKPHVLRYWEKEFSFIRPARRRSRRYYRSKDILIIRQIKDLLYSQYYTIKGARLVLVKKAANFGQRQIVC